MYILVYSYPWLVISALEGSFSVAVCGTPIGALKFFFFFFSVDSLFFVPNSPICFPPPSSDPVKSFTSVIALQKNLWPQSQSELLALARLKSIFYLFCPLDYTVPHMGLILAFFNTFALISPCVSKGNFRKLDN